MKPPALVIGGGVAGAALATHLARAGRQVLLLERERGAHDKVCGEFLSFEAVHYLQALGVDPIALGAARIRGLAVFHRRTTRRAPLPFTALSLSRRSLDEALLRQAEAAGAEVRRGVRATSLDRRDDGWVVRTDVGDEIIARNVLLATGKHDLRGWRRPAGAQPDLLGFKMYWRLADEQARALDESVELHLFGGGYAGLQPVDGGRANLCLVVRKSVFADCGGNWRGLLTYVLEACPTLEARLLRGRASASRPLAVGAIPYGHVQARSDGLWRLGDQAAVIASFTGAGMSIALHSAHLAAGVLASGGGAEQFQRRLASDVRGQVARSTVLSKFLVAPIAQPAIAQMLNKHVARMLIRQTRLSGKARVGPGLRYPMEHLSSKGVMSTRAPPQVAGQAGRDGMAEELVFYTNPMSRGRIARWMLEEVGRPYRAVVLGYGTSMKAPEYLSINPMGKVPAITHRGVTVTEGAAICAYLADAFPEAGLAPDVSDPLRGTYYRWLFFAAGPVEAAVTAKSLNLLAPADKKTMAGYGSFEDTIDALEHAVKDGPFILGERFSAADVYVGAQIGWGLMFKTIEPRPAFTDYVARIQARPAAKRANELDDKDMAESQAQAPAG